MTNDGWFYIENGIQVGPVSPAELEALIKSDKIDRTTHVWNTSLSAWKNILETDLQSLFPQASPPPTPARLVNNTWVWILAFLPLLIAMTDAALTGAYVQYLRDEWFRTGNWPGGNPTLELPWFVVLGLNYGICVLDEKLLERSGYKMAKGIWLAVAIIPVYLFMRAKTVDQKPYYGFARIASFILAILS